MKKICMMLLCLVLISSCGLETTESSRRRIYLPAFHSAINTREANNVKQLLIHSEADPNYCEAREGWPESNPLAVVARGQYTSYDEKRLGIFLDPMPDVEVFQILVEAGADVNRRPYVWQKVYTRDNEDIQRIREYRERYGEGDTQEEEDLFIADVNRILKAFLEAGADPDAFGHPYPYSWDARRQPNYVATPGITEKEANQYFAEGTRAINEAIKKGMRWESQVDLLLQYTSLDEKSLEAAKESGDSAMIEKINLLWENKTDFHENATEKTFEGDFEYIIENDSATIIRYTGTKKNLTIPEKIKGYDVTSIGNSAFVYTRLKSVTIPASVTSIGNYAFAYNHNLRTIEIPNSVTSIGSWAFLGCGELTDIRFGDGSAVYEFIDGVLFDKEKNILHTYLNSNNKTFYAIPDSVIYIGNGAFAGSESLETIEIPDSVIGIGEEAFFSCLALIEIEIPYSVISIGDSAFSSCERLESVTTTTPSNSLENSNMLPTLAMGIGNKAFYACWSLTTIEISSSITSIGDNAFYNCINLLDVTIPASVASVGNYAFAECEILPTIEIPDSVTSIGAFAFERCKSLTTIKISDSVTNIRAGTFFWCESLESFEISNSVISIGEQAFRGCDSFTEIVIPDSVTSIGKGAFIYCYNLTRVSIQNSIISIEYETFYDCNSLVEIKIPDSVTSIGTRAFAECDSLTTVDLGNSVRHIGEEAFYACDSLTWIEIPNSVTSIGARAFKYCDSLFNCEVHPKYKATN